MSVELYIVGDCRIVSLNEGERNNLTSVSGFFDAHGSRDMNFPKLETIGYLDISNSANISFPALKRVRKTIDLSGSENISLPVLKTVYCDVDVGNAKNISFPLLVGTPRCVFASGAENVTFPALKKVNKHLTIDNDKSVDVMFPELEVVKEILKVEPESHAEKAIAGLQSASETLNQGIK